MRLIRFCTVTPLLFAAACSSHPHGLPRDPVYMQVNATHRMAIDPEIQRVSGSMYHYLVGQLSYLNQDFPSALSHLEQASKMNGLSASRLHERLAELYVREGKLEQALAETEKALAEEPDSASLLLLRGGILESLERDKEAEPIYQRLTEKQPDLVNAYVFLASLYAKQKNFDKGIATLERLVKRDAHEAMGYYYLGRLYEKAGKLKQAEQSLKEALRRDKKNPSVEVDLMRVLLKQKKLEEAKQMAQRAAESNPHNVIARRVLSEFLLGENRFDEALGYLQDLEHVEEDPSEARYKIGLIQLQKQNFEEAIRQLNLVVAKHPEHTKARYYLATAYSNTGQRKKAVDELNKIGKSDPLYAESLAFSAFLLRQENDLPGAVQAMREALSAKPGDAQYVSYLVLMLREQKNYKEAESFLAEAIKQDAKNDRLLFHYGVVQSDLGRTREALQTMEQVIKLNDKHSDALNFIAYSLADGDRELERAESLVQKALAIKPDDGYYLDTLGWVYYRRGAFAQAEEVLRRAVQITGGDIVITQHYAEALLKNGKEAEATRVMSEALTKAKTGEVKSDEEKEAVEKMKKNLDGLSGGV